MGLKSAVIVISLSLLAGCQTIQESFKPTERKVVDNSLYSSRYPKAVINIDNDYEYIGMVPYSEYAGYANGPGGSMHDNTSFLFVSADEDDFIGSVVSANFWYINKGHWIPGFDKNENIKVDKYISGDQRFDTTIYIDTISRDSKQAALIEDNNYLLPSCMIFKGYQKIYPTGSHKLYMSYGESIDCDDSIKFLPENKNTRKSQEFITEFNSRADDHFKIVNL